MISGGSIIAPGTKLNSSGTLNVSKEIVLDTLINTGKVIFQNREIIINIKNIQGFENISLDNVEKLTLVNIESNVNLSHLERCAPKLSELTIDSCTGLSNERENLISYDRLLSKKIAIHLINMSEFNKAYTEYLPPSTRLIQSELDFNPGQDIEVTEESSLLTTVRPERLVQELAGHTTRPQPMANTERSNTPQSASTPAGENSLTRPC